MSCQGGCSGCSVAVFTQRWLSVIEPLPTVGEVLTEVKLKGTRRQYFWMDVGLSPKIGAWVVVPEVIQRGKNPPILGRGYHIGRLSLVGKAAEKMHASGGYPPIPPIQKILRVANEEDMEQLQRLREKEPEILAQARKLVQEERLDTTHNMKVVDLEMQVDGSRVTIYFTADGRVDFRNYIRRIQESMGLRAEMYQIHERQASGQVGGIGSCGRELCCGSFLRSFHTVTTEMVRYQGLLMNMNRLTGHCGKLKCCLAYELEAYKVALARVPQIERLRTQEGEWRYLRTEVLLERLWFAHAEKGNQVCLLASEAKKLADMNARGEVPPTIEPFAYKFPELATRV
jgi:cell fate regulator YaaT (PSP1 superfamily)